MEKDLNDGVAPVLRPGHPESTIPCLHRTLTLEQTKYGYLTGLYVCDHCGHRVQPR
jgi:hypothetical protein